MVPPQRGQHYEKGTTMSEQNTTVADQGTQVQTQAPSANGTDEAVSKLYATKAEAEAAKPTNMGKKRLFEVTKDGTSRWGWCNGYDHILATAARADGYTASLGGKAKEVTKEAVAAKLAMFSDDELAAMGLTRKPQKGKK
jgi:hypothetical protein